LTMQAYGDQVDTCPGVEPAVQELKLGRTGWELKEPESGAEGGEAAITYAAGAARTPARCPRNLR